MSLAFVYLLNFIICIVGFIICIIIFPLLALLIMWIIERIKPKWKIAKKKRLIIAFIPSVVLYILLVGMIFSAKYIYTGLGALGDAYAVSFPLNYASKIEYPPEYLHGDDFGEIKYINFIGNISNKAIARLDALCEETDEMVNSSKDIICHYPVPNENQSGYLNYNPKGIPRGWSKNGGIYYFSSEYGSTCYYFTIDISTKTAIAEQYKW